MSQYMAVWYDEWGLSRAWGSGPTKEDAESMADIQADEYLTGRPDVTWSKRRTFEFIDEVPFEIASEHIRP